jgi:hypothetical protein
VTFLFTDLEASTRLLKAHPDAYRAASGFPGTGAGGPICRRKGV